MAAETWHNLVGSKSWNRAQESTLEMVALSCYRDSMIWEMLVPWDDHQVQQQVWSGGSLSLLDKIKMLQMADLKM